MAARGQVVAERQVLVDDLDPLLARLDGLVKMHRLAADANFAVRRGKIPRDHLDQGRLAGAVVAHEAQDFARIQRQIDLVERMDGAEMLRYRL